jgi:apolipoprotein N-acyltransferase
MAGRRSKHSQTRASSTPLVVLAGIAVGVTLTAVAWWYLVGAAIDFGVLARDGDVGGWLFVTAASVGAIVCLLLLLALLGRGMRLLGFITEYQPRRAAARRRR